MRLDEVVHKVVVFVVDVDLITVEQLVHLDGVEPAAAAHATHLVELRGAAVLYGGEHAGAHGGGTFGEEAHEESEDAQGAGFLLLRRLGSVDDFFLVHLKLDDIFPAEYPRKDQYTQENQYGENPQNNAIGFKHTPRAFPIAIRQIHDGAEDHERDQHNVKENLEHSDHDHGVGNHVEFVFPAVFAIVAEAYFRSVVVVINARFSLHNVIVRKFTLQS